ncbi:ATPase, P type cation/copper-transporter [Ilyonectria robusta]
MATPVYFLAADLFHTRDVKEVMALWRRNSRTQVLHRFYRFGSMNTLTSLGTNIAYVSSVAQLIAAGVNQPLEINNSNFYFDSVIFLTFFLLVGRLIESFSKARAGNAVKMLGKLRPTTAILVERSRTKVEEDSDVQADLLEFGDIIHVPHSASPPADGIVVQGESNFNESTLTGESRPVKKRVSDEVFSGTVNKDASVLIQITGVAGKSMLDQIVNVVREGQTKRAPIEQIADVMTTYFVPVITIIAILTWVIWMSLSLSSRIPSNWLDVSSGGWVVWSLQFATAVFVVACPCGLALAAPTAIFVGGGLAAKHGILAKGSGEAFEKASKVDCVIFDKTGTLTMGGEPSITDSKMYPDSDDVDEARKSTFLAALKAVEENSSHPIAKAIVSFCTTKTSESANIDSLEEIPGQDMKATHTGSTSESSFELIVGNEALMTDFSVHISPTVAALLQEWKTEAKSIALAATKPICSSAGVLTPTYTLAAALSISDPVRPEAPAIIRALHSRGTAVWLLSGDNPTTAAAVALQLGINIDNVIAGVLPTQKAEKSPICSPP